MRDGGMVLSYGVVTFDRGRMHVDKTGYIGDLQLNGPVQVPTPPGTLQMFGGLAPTAFWQNVNATADTTWTGGAMVAMYKARTSQDLAGVIYMDVPALGVLLDAIGGVTVDGIPQPLTGANLGTVLLHDLYANAGPNDDPARREQLVKVVAAVVQKLSTGSFDLVKTVQGLGDAAAGRHLWLYSAHQNEQDVFQQSGLGGGPGAVRPDRTFHVSIQNATATKLDYYVHPRVTVDVHLTELGTAIVRSSVAIKNDAPAGPPSYALGGPSSGQKRVGEYVTRVYFWGPSVGEQQDSVAESGLRLNQTPVSVLPGKEATLRFETVIPNAVRNGRIELRLVPQARLAPMDLVVELHAPGWNITGSREIRQSWSKTTTVAWGLRK
jgi:hypothetical protein